ncbi:MAG: hypothetical protein QM747_14435 [Nocardioides sp.]
MTGRLVRAAAALVVAAVLLGPSAQAHAPRLAPQRPALGHTTNEWLMMGRNCGASQTAM